MIAKSRLMAALCGLGALSLHAAPTLYSTGEDTPDLQGSTAEISQAAIGSTFADMVAGTHTHRTFPNATHYSARCSPNHASPQTRNAANGPTCAPSTDPHRKNNPHVETNRATGGGAKTGTAHLLG